MDDGGPSSAAPLLPALLPTRRLGVLAGEARVREAAAFKAHGNAHSRNGDWHHALRNYAVALWLLRGDSAGRMPPPFLVAPGARPVAGAAALALVGAGGAPRGAAAWWRSEEARALRTACHLNGALAALELGDAALAAACAAHVADDGAAAPADRRKATFRLAKARAAAGDARGAAALLRALAADAPPPVAREARALLAALRDARAAAPGAGPRPMAVAPRPPAPAAAAGAAAPPPRGQRVSSYLWRAVAAFLAGDAAALRAAACACDALRRATARDDLWARALAALGALHAGRGGARARAVRAAAFRAPRAVGVASSRARGAHGRAVGAARAALAVDAPPAPTGAALGLDGRGRLAFWRPRPARRRRTPAAWRRFAGAVDRGGAGAPRPAPETAGFVRPTRLSWSLRGGMFGRSLAERSTPTNFPRTRGRRRVRLPRRPRRVAGIAANAGPGVAAVVFGEVDGDGPEPRAEFRGLAVGPVVCGSYGFTDAPLCDGRCLGAFALHGASGALGGGDDFEAAVLEGGEAARGTLAGAAHVQQSDPWRPAVRGAYDADPPAPARVDPADADAVGHWARATLALDARGPPRGCVDAPSARVRRVAAVLTVEARGADSASRRVLRCVDAWVLRRGGLGLRARGDAPAVAGRRRGRVARARGPRRAPGRRAEAGAGRRLPRRLRRARRRGLAAGRRGRGRRAPRRGRAPRRRPRGRPPPPHGARRLRRRRPRRGPRRSRRGVLRGAAGAKLGAAAGLDQSSAARGGSRGGKMMSSLRKH